MAGLQIYPEELGMENQVLNEFRMMLIETDVANFDRRQLDSTMRTLQPYVFCSHLSFMVS